MKTGPSVVELTSHKLTGHRPSGGTGTSEEGNGIFSQVKNEVSVSPCKFPPMKDGRRV